MPCPLCEAVQTEKGLYEDEFCKLLRPTRMKGHSERLMIVSREHSAPPWIPSYLLQVGEREGLKRFDYTFKFVILATDYASVPDHPHFILSDLELGSEDHRQVLGTRWMRVVEVRPWISWSRA